MTSLALSFNEVNFSPVERDGQIWLTAGELARALGYTKANAVTQVYERNQDEFNQSMTQVIDNPQSLNLRLRIFSLRGAHLIAMFSKTAIAKQFRKWVLDVLDREVMSQQVNSKQTISPEQAGILYNIVHTRAGENKNLIVQMWSRLKNHFKYSASYRELRAIHFEDAKHYLEVMDLRGKAEKQEVKSDKIEVDKHYHQSVQGLAWHMLWVREWWKEFGEPLRKLSPNMAGAVHDHFVDGAMFAFHFIDKDELKKQQERMNYRQWHLSATERMALEFKNK